MVPTSDNLVWLCDFDITRKLCFLYDIDLRYIFLKKLVWVFFMFKSTEWLKVQKGTVGLWNRMNGCKYIIIVNAIWLHLGVLVKNSILPGPPRFAFQRGNGLTYQFDLFLLIIYILLLLTSNSVSGSSREEPPISTPPLPPGGGILDSDNKFLTN